MNQIVVLIEGEKTTVELSESLMVNSDSYVYVDNTIIFWGYSNVRKGENDERTYDGNENRFEPGY